MIAFLREKRGWLVAAVISAAAALRFLCIGKFPYFIDEIHALRYTRAAFSHAARLPSDLPIPAPLDYALVNILQRVSPHEAFMRLPYATAGILSVFVLYSLCSRWFGRRRALVAAGLMALSTSHIYYSQSIRCYSLGMLLLLLAVEAYDSAFRDGSKWAGIRFALFSALAFLNQYFSLIPIGLLMVHALAGLWKGREKKDDFRKVKIETLVCAAVVVGIIFILNWKVILLPKSLGFAMKGTPPLTLALQTFHVFEMFTSIGAIAPQIAVFALFVFGIFYAGKHWRYQAGLFSILILAPVPFIVFQESRVKAGGQLRHLFFAAPFYMMLASLGMEWLCKKLSGFRPKRRLVRALRTDWFTPVQWELALCIVLLWLLVPSLSMYYSEPFRFNGGEADPRVDFRTPAARLARLTNRGDIIIFSGIANGPWRYCIDFYLDELGQQRAWTPFTEIESIDESALTGRRVTFVYFDFPFRYTRDFLSMTRLMKAYPLNDFTTLFVPVKPVRSRAELLAEAERFGLMAAPPSDYGFYSHVYTNLGVVARMRGDEARAEAFGKKAVDSAKTGVMNFVFDEIDAHEQLGLTYYRSGDFDGALEEWQVAEALIPTRMPRELFVMMDYHPEWLYVNMSEAFSKIGLMDKAAAYARKALEFAPGYAPAKRILGKTG